MRKLSFIAFLVATLIIPSILLAGGNGAVKGDMIEYFQQPNGVVVVGCMFNNR